MTLRQATAEDPAFDAELRGAWAERRPYLTTSDDRVINSISGTVEGHAVQARDVHGGISFDKTDRSDTDPGH